MEEIEQLAQMIKNSSRIVAFTGAGVSTESGIPDFRSSGGIYDLIGKEYGRPPEVLLSHDFFVASPGIFYDYLRKYLVFPQARPNAAHLALARLEREGRLSAVVTQNIDGLHTKAGCRHVYELHGNICRNYCTGCGAKYELSFVMASKEVPHCEKCGAIVRPDVVLYGEMLDARTLESAAKAISSADMLLVMGTSLAVYPAAGLLHYYQGDRLVLINKTATPYDYMARLVIHESAGSTLEKALSYLT